jgi:hypothetical protein
VPVNSTSSLAVFYVEQVALNRHVTPDYGTFYLEGGEEGCQGEIFSADETPALPEPKEGRLTTYWREGASNRRRA